MYSHQLFTCISTGQAVQYTQEYEQQTAIRYRSGLQLRCNG